MARRNYSSGLANVEIEQLGSKELQKSLRGMDKEFKKEISKDMRGVGNLVRDHIRSRTQVGRKSSPGHKAGTLRRSIKSKLSRLSVRIFSDATRVSRKYSKGYRYGKRLEFDPAFGGRFAFFYAGWIDVKDEAWQRYKAVLDKVAAAFRNGG